MDVGGSLSSKRQENITSGPKTMMMMMRRSGPSGVFLLLFIMFQISVPVLGSVVRRHYNYVRHYFTWSQAQAYCRNSAHYVDLATIYKASDLSNMYMTSYAAWVNLHNPNADSDDSSKSDWVWAGQFENKLDDNWANDEPDAGESCAMLYSTTSKFYGTSCERLLFFICYIYKKSGNHYYKFIPLSKTWSEAGQHCKAKGFTNLASYMSYANLNDTADADADFPVWIGLHKDGETWKWSTGLSDYADEGWHQDIAGNCATISSVGKLMVPKNCEDRFPFVCYRDNLVLIKENKTWEEALEYCMTIGYRLVSVQPGADHDYMMNIIEYEGSTEKVWTGLRFLAGHWVFTNRATVSYSDLPQCPVEEQHCGTFLRNDTASMHPTNCLEKWNFLCYY